MIIDARRALYRDAEGVVAVITAVPTTGFCTIPPTTVVPLTVHHRQTAAGLLRYQGDVLPNLKGRLVIALHGYRAQGHRLMSLAVGTDGQPSAAPSPLIWGWDQTEQNPQGAPVGLAEMKDGSVLVIEDHNGTLLRLARP